MDKEGQKIWFNEKTILNRFILNMVKFITKNFFLFKIFLCLLLSLLIYLSFRFSLNYENNIKIIISFFLVQFIVWSICILPKKKYFSVIFYNLFFLIIFNLVLTPLFHLFTFDVPVRKANYEITKEYKSDFFKGMFFGRHYISSDHKGYRSNKTINYEKKNKNTTRIFTIGASTTEQGETDNDKTWSSLLEKKLKDFSEKKIEVINAGMAGLRSKHHFVTLKRIQKYEPDIVIFLMGINDWNYHIINSEKKYLIPSYEIKYDYKNSVLFKIFGNINKQIHRKLKRNKKIENKALNTLSAEFDTEGYLLPQINSLKIRKITKNFKPKKISQRYQYWSKSIINECKKLKLTCIFLDQPTAYKENISEKLKKRLWMTPPNQDYTLNLESLIYISKTYNEWLQKEVTNSNLNFLIASDKIEADINHLFDDCHFTEEGSKKMSDLLINYINLNLKSALN